MLEAYHCLVVKGCGAQIERIFGMSRTTLLPPFVTGEVNDMYKALWY